MSLVDERTWQLSEAPFLPGKLHHTETIYTVGNGFMGVRATFEEGYPGELASTLVHGLFDHAEGDLVPIDFQGQFFARVVQELLDDVTWLAHARLRCSLT